MKTPTLILAVMLLTLPTLRAQIVADGASLTLSNVTDSFPGDVVIGTNSSFTLLVLSDNALLGNSGNGIIGLNLTAKSNEVRLISPTAYWFVETNLFIGSNGSFNRLTISNGARVETRGGFIGGFHFLGSNNEAVVTGAGSLWSNSGLSIGTISSGNRLVISNGGRVSSGGSLLGVADPFDARNNTALVTGAGSTWNNQAGLDIGYSGSNCRMIISNAAFVDNALGRIGHGASGLSASNCEAVVTGSGSVWSNRTGLLVGEFGNAARLVVTNGGAVIALGDVLLGRPFTSTNNRIIVAGGTLRATNAAGTATLDLLRGTNQFNAGVIEADFLRMANTLGLFEFNGGLLTTRGAFITNAPFVVGGPGNIPALWDVRAGVSNYFLSSDLYIGSNSLLNQLVITNGALLNNNAGFLGFIVGARSNLAVVAGVNSVWNNRADLDVGFSGAGNQLVVTNGGVVRNNFGILGVNGSSSNNVALVAGSGSVWTNANDVYVGRSGANNQLLVSAGGLVRNNDGYLGVNTGSSSNLAVVTGLGSVWSNAGSLFLGQDDQGNRLVVTNEGVVRSSSAFFGLNTGSSNNLAVVTGSGSGWTNARDFYAGYSSARNQLVVTNGGTVVSSNGYLGFFSSSSNNLALVTGTGSVWSNRADVYVGNSGRANQLVASEGATVLTGGNGTLGRNTGANSNAVWLTDAGTSWKIATNLYVGSNGAFNLLVVSNGALVANGSGFIGAGVSSSNNLAVVTGAGSAWTNGAFYVGNSGAGNRLVVSNGGLVQCSSGALGLNSSSSNNEATITGAGSLWTIGGNSFSLGLNGTGNRLVVSNGGRMHNGQALIGGSPNNEVLVTGAGSSWTNLTTLIMGLVLGGNRLTVSNGAVVYAAFDVQLGGISSSTNNRIVVDGGILVAAHPTLGVLDVRRGTNVLNMGLIDVSGLLLTNALGFFELNGGTLSAGRSTIANGQLFRVGNGISPATMRLAGNGSHTFGSGLAVSANAALLGNGNLGGSLTVSNGGTFSPGLSVGKIVLSNSPSLQGATIMEISKSGGTLTNDQIQVIGPLTYGGSLTVSKLGADTLAAGDNFRLFVASSYAGAFSSISLPPLGPELIWTNKLLVDGSMEVISIPPGDHFWTNALGGFYAAPANWLLNSVPDVRDNAGFTNNAGYQVHMLGINPANASAFFNAASGIVTQALFNSSWTLTNSYIVGRDSASTATVTHTVGFLRVTNSAGNAPFVIGRSGGGTYNLNGGNVTVDYLFATNNGPGLAGSVFNFNSGSLTTLHGSTISQSDDFFIGDVSGTAAWTMSGGTNRIANGDFQFTRIGVSSGARGVVTVTGSGTEWINSGSLLVGSVGSSNQLFIRAGGKVVSSTGYIGITVGSSDNEAWISDGDSLWTCSDAQVGAGGRNSRLVVTNGGRMSSLVAAVGTGITSSNNSVLVTGAGSVWNNQFDLYLGNQGSSNSVAIASNGLVSAGSLVSIGAFADSSNNVLTVTGGNLVVTNGTSDALLQVGGGGQGTLVLNSGTVRADQLAVTNGAKSVFTFNGGTLRSGNTTISNGLIFSIGDGVSPATFELVGNGTHSFANPVIVSANAQLKGSGSVMGNVFINGGFAPGASIGRIAIAGGLTFGPGAVTSFELDKAAGTNDSVVGLTNLLYQGTLIVTNLGGTLASGDRFDLFDYSSRQTSAFTNLVLPPLDAGLKWRNKLVMDGSLEVITIPTRDFGVDVSLFQGASGISQASWNQMFAEGKRFAFVKATEGLTGPHDGTMSNNVTRAAAAGLLVGVYHYAHPENRPTTNGAILEASNMVVYAGSAIGPGRLRPVLDVEGAATTLSTTALTDWVIAFSDEIIARRGPGAAPIIYCTKNAANFEFDSRLANYDLWLQAFSNSDPATDDPIDPTGLDPTGVFNDWSFWQYSHTGTSGGISPLDLDVCHSEYKPLSSYLIPGAAPSPIQLTGTSVTTNSAFQFSFTNTPGAVFIVLATTNLAAPLSSWTLLGLVPEISPGQFQFTDNNTPTSPMRFYRALSP